MAGKQVWGLGWHTIAVVHDLDWHAGDWHKLVHLGVEGVSLHAIGVLVGWGELGFYQTAKQVIELGEVEGFFFFKSS